MNECFEGFSLCSGARKLVAQVEMKKIEIHISHDRQCSVTKRKFDVLLKARKRWKVKIKVGWCDWHLCGELFYSNFYHPICVKISLNQNWMKKGMSCWLREFSANAEPTSVLKNKVFEIRWLRNFFFCLVSVVRILWIPHYIPTSDR